MEDRSSIWDSPPKRSSARKGDLTIRRAELGDDAALARLMCELGYDTRTAEMKMRLESILDDSRYQTLVAVSGGTVCGMIGCFLQRSYEHNDVGGRILALVVTESMRGQGIGQELVHAAESDFVAKNINRIAVNTRFERKEAHEFYEKVGYVRNGFRFVKNLPAVAD